MFIAFTVVLGAIGGLILGFSGVPETWYGFLGFSTLSGVFLISLSAVVSVLRADHQPGDTTESEPEDAVDLLRTMALTVVPGSVAIAAGANPLTTLYIVLAVQAICSFALSSEFQ